MKGDDWSFVIKTHALMEMAVSRALLAVVMRSELEDELKDIDCSQKVSFLRALNIFESQDKNFVRWFSKLRNDLAHDIRNVTFTFSEWLKDKTREQSMREVFKKLAPPPEAGEKRLNPGEFAIAHPKIAILGQVFVFISKTRDQEDKALIATIHHQIGAMILAEEREKHQQAQNESTPMESTPTHQSQSPQE